MKFMKRAFGRFYRFSYKMAMTVRFCYHITVLKVILLPLKFGTTSLRYLLVTKCYITWGPNCDYTECEGLLLICFVYTEYNLKN